MVRWLGLLRFGRNDDNPDATMEPYWQVHEQGLLVPLVRSPANQSLHPTAAASRLFGVFSLTSGRRW
jgi:hypothetical protein